jgi:hypothetical protein
LIKTQSGYVLEFSPAIDGVLRLCCDTSLFVKIEENKVKNLRKATVQLLVEHKQESWVNVGICPDLIKVQLF